MAANKRKPISIAEIRDAFREGPASRFGPILTVKELAELARVSEKTIYFWIAKGRLDGAFRKRGKHNLIWRDKVIDLLFNSNDWETNDE